jgi:hypothetical protein
MRTNRAETLAMKAGLERVPAPFFSLERFDSCDIGGIGAENVAAKSMRPTEKLLIDWTSQSHEEWMKYGLVGLAGTRWVGKQNRRGQLKVTTWAYWLEMGVVMMVLCKWRTYRFTGSTRDAVWFYRWNGLHWTPVTARDKKVSLLIEATDVLSALKSLGAGEL